MGPSPLLLFRLPNYQAEVAVWFALFLCVKRPHSPISPTLGLGGGVSHGPSLPHLLIHTSQETGEVWCLWFEMGRRALP